MAKIFVLLLLLFYSVKANTEYEYEIIDEFIPKTIIAIDRIEKIFKYELSCKDERNETNIYFQEMSDSFGDLYLYDDFNKIQKIKEYYQNYTSHESIRWGENISFKNLTCNKDYFFVLEGNNYKEGQHYFQIWIVNEETQIFNLSPTLSLYYTLFPRIKNKTESFYYSFNETKYAFINYNGLLKIEENGKIIYNNTNLKLFKFQKNLNYSIFYTSDTAMQIQFYNESNFFKYNKEDFPLILYGKNNEYYFEINISDYKIGEYILLQTFDNAVWFLKYQYKNDFKKNNFINLGGYNNFNYIPIKKTKNDSSLLLYIKFINIYPNLLITIINIVKNGAIEIDSDFNSTFIGPKFLYLDYYKFNNFKSFAIKSNKNYIFFEQEMEYKIHMDKKEYNGIYISKQNDKKSLLYKRGFIYLNSSDTWNLEIKKLNFTIFENVYSRPGHEYINLCQGEEPKKELYYYKSRKELLEFFTPVFGNFDIFIIKEENIKTLSDFNFNSINQTNIFMPEYQNGYFKIVCKGPTMIKHSFIDRHITDYELTYGKSRIFSIDSSKSRFYLSNTLKGKTISLKFSILGGQNIYQVELNINGTEHILCNKSLELEYYFQETDSNFIYLNTVEEIEEEILIEIVIGMKEELKKFPIKNLNESFGILKIDEQKGYIIKVPKEYEESYYNFSIFLKDSGFKTHFYVEIIYDKIEFIPLNIMNETIYEFSQDISFFVNPYSYIPNNNEKSDEKYFYNFIIYLWLYNN